MSLELEGFEKGGNKLPKVTVAATEKVKVGLFRAFGEVRKSCVPLVT